MQTEVVWTCLPFIWSDQTHLARHSERGKKTRQAEEEVGRQHLGIDRPAVHKVPEGGGEQKQMEETVCVCFLFFSCLCAWSKWAPQQ